MQVTVLHNISRDAGLGINQVFSRAGKHYEPRSHELVKVFEFDAADLAGPGADQAAVPPSAFADTVFRVFNVGHEPGLAATMREYELAVRYRERGLRSLSKGDVLFLDDGGTGTFLACESLGWFAYEAEDLNILGPGAADAAVRARYDFKPGEELTVTVPLVTAGDVDRADLVTVPTPLLRPGDIVLHHGMVILIDGPACVFHGQCEHPLERVPSGPGYHPPRDPEMVEGAQCRIGYAWPGRVLNVPEVIEAGFIPRFFMYDNERNLNGPGHGREDHWNVQGNVLARWAVARPAPEETSA